MRDSCWVNIFHLPLPLPPRSSASIRKGDLCGLHQWNPWISRFLLYQQRGRIACVIYSLPFSSGRLGIPTKGSSSPSKSLSPHNQSLSGSGFCSYSPLQPRSANCPPVKPRKTLQYVMVFLQSPSLILW